MADINYNRNKKTNTLTSTKLKRFFEALEEFTDSETDTIIRLTKRKTDDYSLILST